MKRYAGLWFPEDEALTEELRARLDEPQGYHGDRLVEALTQVPRFGVAVDVGAHVGAWTTVLADRFERVIALEPDPASAECLRRNVAAFDNVVVHQVAAGELNYRCGWQRDKGRIGAHVAVDDAHGDVEVVTLDSLALERVDYLKVHANGYELPVLQGAVRTIRRCRPVMTVVFKPKPETTRRYGYDAKELEYFILGLGYARGRGQKPYRVFLPA